MARVYCDDGSYYDDSEGSLNQYKIECRLNPETYQKLLGVARKEGIRTFDISTVINYVIKNYKEK